jgi:hypothetical protein
MALDAYIKTVRAPKQPRRGLSCFGSDIRSFTPTKTLPTAKEDWR